MTGIAFVKKVGMKAKRGTKEEEEEEEEEGRKGNLLPPSSLLSLNSITGSAWMCGLYDETNNTSS